jgi:hypothetical protein
MKKTLFAALAGFALSFTAALGTAPAAPLPVAETEEATSSLMACPPGCPLIRGIGCVCL